MSGSFAIYPSLAGKVAVVTGGALGIGACIVEHLIEQDAVVAFLDVAEHEGRALESRLLGGATFLHCDLRDLDALRHTLDRITARLGPVRTLVNNAGRDQRQAVEEVTPLSWDAVMADNLRHPFFAAQYLAKGMAAAGGGSIVNLGSTAWRKGLGGMAAYLSAKAGIEGMTRALARELGDGSVRVNAVVPGAVMTERQRSALRSVDEARLLQEQCLAKLLEPADIARMVLFLAADDSAMCTSQTFVVDAGWT